MEPFLSVYGHVAIDQICTVRKFPRDNTTEDVLTKTTVLGGTGPNIAVHAARLGFCAKRKKLVFRLTMKTGLTQRVFCF